MPIVLLVRPVPAKTGRNAIGENMFDTRVEKFPLGQLIATRAVAERMKKDMTIAAFVQKSIRRHARGDWGDISQEDKTENEFSVDKYLRIMSSYSSDDGTKIWLITEADRKHTTVLFPDEY